MKPTPPRRDHSGRLTFDFPRIEADQYSSLCGEIARRFELKPAGKRVVGLDEVFQDYRQGDALAGLEWDIWTGFVVAAQNRAAEPLVLEIVAWLKHRVPEE